MKQILKTVILGMLLVAPSMLFAQRSNRSKAAGARQRMEKKEEAKSSLSVRAQQMFGTSNNKQVIPAWSRVVYRALPDTIEQNKPLYFPVDPIGNRVNLFTLIFRLLINDQLAVYEYLDGRESFSDKYKMNVVDLLNKYEILAEEEIERGSKKVRYKIDESDIPSRDIKNYYLKETYSFDQRTSTYQTEIVAICPIMYREEEYGGALQRIPMFWISFDQLKTYLNEMPIMVSNMNNAMRLTYGDFFDLKKYKGLIYKTANLSNKSLVQIVKNDTSKLRKERQKIELQLKDFEENLWTTKKDTTQVVDKDDKKKKTKKLTARAELKEQPKKKKSKSVKSKSNKKRSVRASVRRR